MTRDGVVRTEPRTIPCRTNRLRALSQIGPSDDPTDLLVVLVVAGPAWHAPCFGESGDKDGLSVMVPQSSAAEGRSHDVEAELRLRTMRVVLGRQRELLLEDVALHEAALAECIGNARILVTGAAGSIGAAVSHSIARYQPAALVLVDTSENTLVELVRDLRSSPGPVPGELQSLSIELGSTGFKQYLHSVPPFDYLLNFAALKHVRAERDPFTLMRMLDTNVLALARVLALLSSQPGSTHVFSVSSDKAVNPHNLMGASKALMEALLWRHLERLPTSSARFANVAFSHGSLLDGFEHRLRKGQPLSAPSDIRRYFITHDEAAHLCLLACFVAEPGNILVPKLEASEHLVCLSDIAVAMLQARGLSPRLADSEEQARAWAAERTPHAVEWPCYFAPSSTSGEKPYEELVHPMETRREDRFADAIAVNAVGAPHATVDLALSRLGASMNERPWSVDRIAALLAQAVPTLSHRSVGQSLDEKM